MKISSFFLRFVLLLYTGINAQSLLSQSASCVSEKLPHGANCSSLHPEQNDSVPDIVITTPSHELPPLYYINSHPVTTAYYGIDPQMIDSIRVEKVDTEWNHKKYYGKVFIYTNRNYHPQIILLSELKKQYALHPERPTVYRINDQLINEDENLVQIDLKSILKIQVDYIETNQCKVNFIQLIRRSQEHIDCERMLHIR